MVLPQPVRVGVASKFVGFGHPNLSLIHTITRRGLPFVLLGTSLNLPGVVCFVPDYPNGLVSRWVDPNSNLMNPPTHPTSAGISAQVVAIRVWLRIRAEAREVDYVDGKTYNYAGISYTPAGADAGVRRMLVSRTIYLRNARTY